MCTLTRDTPPPGKRYMIGISRLFFIFTIETAYCTRLEILTHLCNGVRDLNLFDPCCFSGVCKGVARGVSRLPRNTTPPPSKKYLRNFTPPPKPTPGRNFKLLGPPPPHRHNSALPTLQNLCRTVSGRKMSGWKNVTLLF